MDQRSKQMLADLDRQLDLVQEAKRQHYELALATAIVNIEARAARERAAKWHALPWWRKLWHKLTRKGTP